MGVSTVNWQGRFAILGWGVSGKASARALLARGAQLRAFDGRSPDTSSHGEALTPAQPDELTDVEVVYNTTRFFLLLKMLASLSSAKLNLRGVYKKILLMRDGPGCA